MGISTSCESCAVRHRALCGALSDRELERLASLTFQKVLKSGSEILSDSERPAFFANILSGVVKLSKVMPDGRQQIVGLQFASDFIGRPFSARNPFFAEAASDVVLCCFDSKRFEELTRDVPDLEHRMFEHTLDELDAARSWMVLLGRKSAEERLASFLAQIATRTQMVGCGRCPSLQNEVMVELPLTRAEIADYLGLTIETVSRQFSKLKSRGLIVLERGRFVRITDLAELQMVSGEVEVEDAL